MSTIGPDPLPRELAPGVHWLGSCLEHPYGDRVLHGYNSVYLVSGEHSSILVEAGFPDGLDRLEGQLAGLLAAGLPPLRYLFPTHQETPHASGIGRLLQRHPDAVVVGDVRDYPLVFPHLADRFRPLREGDALDLGGTAFRFVEPVLKDLPSTLWGFDTARRVLFPGDGFAFSHYHEDGHCGRFAEEAGSIDLPDMTALFAELALHWTTFVDMAPWLRRLDGLLDRLGVELVAPTHGLPVTDLAATLPEIREGLLLGSRGPA